MSSKSIQTRPRRHLPGLAASLSAAVSALLIVTGCTADKPQPTTPPTRVLQSVAVQMTPDGTMTAVNGTAVSVRDNASDATTQDTTYSPRQVADDLPVRVSTSYRTDKKTGTNLEDLNGYTGRVEIDLSVQNLTVKPQNLKYDVAGTSQTQPAMVGAPLTVVASTSLPDIKPTDVVTASAPGDSAATNGVLSQSEKGGSVIQWAALLAAPQTGTAATLRLVSDVKNFSVPTIDLSVEPGLVTDPSVSGVIDSAFNSDPASQLALEQRTIKVITDANQVLTRASDNISDVRKNLDSTSKTLGSRTTEELKTSTKGVTSSMKDLDQELKSLNSDISGTLGDTQSTVLQELGQTVGAMDQMLGDTSAAPPPPEIDGNGCKTVVKDPKNAGTVYGNLMEVTAQLDGYSTATGRCKKEAQQVLLRSVGPEKPTAELCDDKPSTTCALFNTEQKFSSIMEDLVAQGDKLVDSLQPEVVTNADDEYAALSDEITQVQKAIWNIQKYDSYADIDKRLDDVTASLDAIAGEDGTISQLSGQITAIGDGAEEAHDQLSGTGNKDEDKAHPSMLSQNADLATQLCRLPRDNGPLGKTLNGLSEDEIERLRAYLVDTPCPKDRADYPDGISGLRKPLLPDLPFYKDSMATRLQDQRTAWNDVIAKTNVKDTHHEGIGKSLAELRKDILNTQGLVEDVRKTKDDDKTGLSDRLTALEKSGSALDTHRVELGEDLKALKKQQDSLAPTINKAFNDAADQANDQVSGAIDPQIRKVTTQAAVDSQAVGDMFDQSAAGLSNASDEISRNGTRTIKAQRQKLEESEKSANSAASKQVNQSLTQMAKGVSASTKDMNGASDQLTDSLKKVLLDLGTRKVHGSGLLGSMTTSAAKVGTADYQLALASTTTTSYAGVRNEDVNGILLRQAQLSAALQAGADLPAFHLNVPAGAQSQTVYTFQIKEPK